MGFTAHYAERAGRAKIFRMRLFRRIFHALHLYQGALPTRVPTGIGRARHKRQHITLLRR